MFSVTSIWVNSIDDMPPGHLLKHVSIISRWLPLLHLPFIFPITRFSNASHLIAWSKNDISLFLIVEYSGLPSLVTSRQTLLVTLTFGAGLRHGFYRLKLGALDLLGASTINVACMNIIRFCPMWYYWELHNTSSPWAKSKVAQRPRIV